MTTLKLNYNTAKITSREVKKYFGGKPTHSFPNSYQCIVYFWKISFDPVGFLWLFPFVYRSLLIPSSTLGSLYQALTWGALSYGEVCLSIPRWRHIMLGVLQATVDTFFFYEGPYNKYFRPSSLYNMCGDYSTPLYCEVKPVIDNT